MPGQPVTREAIRSAYAALPVSLSRPACAGHWAMAPASDAETRRGVVQPELRAATGYALREPVGPDFQPSLRERLDHQASREADIPRDG